MLRRGCRVIHTPWTSATAPTSHVSDRRPDGTRQRLDTAELPPGGDTSDGKKLTTAIVECTRSSRCCTRTNRAAPCPRPTPPGGEQARHCHHQKDTIMPWRTVMWRPNTASPSSPNWPITSRTCRVGTLHEDGLKGGTVAMAPRGCLEHGSVATTMHWAGTRCNIGPVQHACTRNDTNKHQHTYERMAQQNVPYL